MKIIVKEHIMPCDDILKKALKTSPKGGTMETRASRVLIVDDMPINRFYFLRSLPQAGSFRTRQTAAWRACLCVRKMIMI